MAKFVIRNVEKDEKRRPKRRAQRHAVRAESSKPAGLGSRIAAEFAGHGLRDGELPALRGAWAKLVHFAR